MSNIFEMKDNTTNPGPLGLVGFGLATIMLNLHNAGFHALDTMVLSMGLLLGGLLQLIVGLLEYKKNNMFGMIAFGAYGAFWLSLIFLMILPKMGLGEAPAPEAMGYYCSVWAIFSLGMFFATMKSNMASRILFAAVTVLFALLAIADFTGIHGVKTLAGFEGIFAGSLALYIAIAELYHDVYGKKILPLG